jgi:hypothetical protein
MRDFKMKIKIFASMNQQNLFMIKEYLEEYPDKLKVYLKQLFN